MKRLLLCLCTSIAFCGHANAQEYTFQLNFGTAPTETETLENGAIRYTFPAGTDLNDLGLTCTVPSGATVTPNPASARIQDDAPEIFTVTYADGTQKAFPYYFTAGRWFTAVLFGDPEIDLTDRTNNNATAANLTKWANGIIKMKESNHYVYKTHPNIKPDPDLVICMGDMDGDSEHSGSAIKAVFDLFTAQGIPFITMAGNHDFVPDYWSGENGSAGATVGVLGSKGGTDADNTAITLINAYRNNAEKNGIENVQTFTLPNNSVNFHPTPFVFTFKGVQFYIGQTYWFQKSYKKPLTALGSATYYAPNSIIEQLTTYVSEHKNTPSVWIQHYPISCEDRWWLDQNNVGRSIAPSDTPTYSTAAEKRNKYMDLITQTKNPYHFSGHNHTENIVTHTYNGVGFKDYIAPYFATRGAAWLVLCHEGEGVVEVQSVPFDYND